VEGTFPGEITGGQSGQFLKFNFRPTKVAALLLLLLLLLLPMCLSSVSLA
jgi:hypothetical protein